MFAIIIGGGRTGSYLAKNLVAAGHEVTVIENREEIARKDAKEVSGAKVILTDGADPEQLDLAGAAKADLMAVVTGSDEDNLVICQLAKYNFKVPRVVARVNNPKNEWLYTREWGVDVAVSSVEIISTIIQEDLSLGDVVTLLKLRGGEVGLVEVTVSDTSKAVGKAVKDLSLPADTVLTAILRGHDIIVPKGLTEVDAGDHILILTKCGCERELEEQLS
jgi:trk system potassium uptake protein